MQEGMHGGTKKLLQVAASIFLLTAALGIGWQIFGTSWFKNIKAEITNQPYARTITVSADGKVTAKPDIALITLSVVSQGKTVADVTKDGNAKMTLVIDAVKKLGVEPNDVVTSSYNLWPQYNYPEEKAPTIMGYQLEQGITVKVRKLETVDDVLDASVNVGANQVGQLSFDIDDASIVKKEARTEAFAKTREKAEEMAAAAGVRLGRVVTFTESGEPFYPPYYANYGMDMARSEMAASPAPSIEPGSKELMITVSVTYEIE